MKENSKSNCSQLEVTTKTCKSVKVMFAFCWFGGCRATCATTWDCHKYQQALVCPWWCTHSHLNNTQSVSNNKCTNNVIRKMCELQTIWKLCELSLTRDSVNAWSNRSLEQVICCLFKRSQHEHRVSHFLNTKPGDAKYLTHTGPDLVSIWDRGKGHRWDWFGLTWADKAVLGALLPLRGMSWCRLRATYDECQSRCRTTQILPSSLWRSWILPADCGRQRHCTGALCAEWVCSTSLPATCTSNCSYHQFPPVVPYVLNSGPLCTEQ